MKLKQLEEDFIVEETIDSLNISEKKSNYLVFTLEKKGIETFTLLKLISRKYRINTKDFGIAGLKDKHALTRQYLTIPVKYYGHTEKFRPKLEEKNYSLKFLGFTDKKLSIGDHEYNKFTITVRDIKRRELEEIRKKCDEVEESGVPNYFDSQRFGSVGFDKKTNRFLFIEKFVMKRDYETAVKIFLTSSQKTESREMKKSKIFIKDNWKNISGKKISPKEIKSEIHDEMSKKIILEYYSTDWLDAFLSIPSHLRELYVSAYQSHLWNECIKELLRESIDENNLMEIKYNVGKLVYYHDCAKETLDAIPRSFQMIGDGTKIEENIGKDSFPESRIISKILSEEQMRLEDFKIRKETGNFFKKYSRDVIVIPKEFSYRIEHDEINDKGKKDTYKAIVSFILQKGSYATCITKKIFNQ